MSILLGRGDGSFAPQLRFSVGVGPRAIVVADLNQDGKQDLVTANGGSFSDAIPDDISVLLGNGDGTFGLESRHGVGLEPTAIATADFNGDGHPDLAVAESGSDEIAVFLGSTTGSLSRLAPIPVGDTPCSIAIGDFNADGRPDLAVANRSSDPFKPSGDISILIGAGDGSFSELTRLRAGLTSLLFEPRSIALADFNRDGLQDLVVADARHGVVGFQGLGAGRFVSRGTLFSMQDASSVTAADLNADGWTDAVVTRQFSGLTALINSGDGTFGFLSSFKPVITTAGLDSAELHAVSAGDYNTDGRLDLAVPDGLADDLILLTGRGDGTFAVALPPSYATGPAPWDVLVGEFDNDRKLDLVVASNNGPGSVSFLAGNGDGTFTTERTRTAGFQIRQILGGRFGSDHGRYLDLALLNTGSPGSVSVLLQRGAGRFTPEAGYAVGDDPQSIAVGDFDDDGVPDLISANLRSNDISMLPGRHDGTFGPLRRAAVVPQPLIVAAGDFNEDGRPDLAVTNLGFAAPQPGLSILLGRGDGTFDLRDMICCWTYAGASIMVADLDQDRHEDIVVVHRDQVSIFLGRGDGTFAPETQYATQVFWSTALIADFDGDGRLDLAIQSEQPYVEIFLGRGDGSFTQLGGFRSGRRSGRLAVGDLNGDGRADLVMTDPGDDKVSVLINQGTRVPDGN